MNAIRPDLLALLARTVEGFIALPLGEIDASIDRTLASIGTMFDVDRAYLFRFSEDGSEASNTHEWCAPGVCAQRDNLQGLPTAMLPWWMGELRAGRAIKLASLDQLPPEAAAERAVLEPQDIRSLLVLPVVRHGHLDGFAGFDHVRAAREWSHEEVDVLRVVVGAFAQAFERRRIGEHMERTAYHDALTQLPNRTLLAERLARACSDRGRTQGTLAVAYLDLDDFKSVNDTFGHDAGDRLLVSMAARLCGTLRAEDTVARLGGDEFVLVLPGLDSADEATRLVERLMRVVSSPIEVAPGRSVSLTTSVGMRLVPPDDADADTLLRQADQAMYTAKREGRARLHLFDAEDDRRRELRHVEASRIAAGIEAGEMELHFQPVVDLDSGAVKFAEALVRWRPRDGRLRPPDEWLPLIENDPVMLRLGEWVLDTALGHCEHWLAAGLCGCVSVNVSALELRDPQFPARLKALLGRHPSAPPSCLKLEVLERSVLADLPAVIDNMEQCLAMGVSFALDDFGTGYSSLTFVKRLPVSTVKVDRSFVSNMLVEAGDRAIVKGVVELAHAFGRICVAEGVETPEQVEALRALGCSFGQGYGISPPQPAEALGRWLDERPPWTHMGARPPGGT